MRSRLVCSASPFTLALASTLLACSVAPSWEASLAPATGARRTAPARATGAPACDPANPAVAAHVDHDRDSVAHPALACAECHARASDCAPGEPPATVRFGALAGAGGASPQWDAAARTCSGVYCHGAKMRSPPPAPSWVYVDNAPTRPLAVACSVCHGYPPPAPHLPMTACRGCHPSTVLPDGTIDLAGGHHLDGVVDVDAGGVGADCTACHGFPPATGAHLAHDGLGAPRPAAGYGSVWILQDLFPAASPAEAPPVYSFGCGNCHPIDRARHFDGTVEVTLYEAAAPAGSPKARASASAAYDPATGTCSGVYCHSGGQETPVYVATPGWTSGAKPGCDGCHANPPRYATGGAGAADANSHLALADDGWEYGHFLGLPGPFHGPKHGGAWAGEDAAPITCQTCHFDTTDPSSAGPSGFYWLDTTGAYQLPGGDPSRLTTSWYAELQCTTCHTGQAGGAPAGAGKVLPLRHVNGRRDVAFDPRLSLTALDWLPPAPGRPSRPYWETNAGTYMPWPPDVTWDGGTASFSLAASSYDPATKTCSNVACHLVEQPVWGRPYQWITDGGPTCNACHPM
ncbi:CxxxxCH/CxxCH domain c-type cytochrome [Anaeromyxobacter diazotrophicus]|uniref:Cytochrome C family protein n=1 Tax=Anaeromyxobacter diazotrophicus TaxID=2590199 RepID=A0A7I9VKW8_9BACT|nr:CxxxxCH/CxxCH domain-containing protein [Anaeromyxobacter diazotrophicus]GEJ57064.1 hypothetical protein AMYX_18050 [Anaeromyxobacter diazotrophicus]